MLILQGLSELIKRAAFLRGHPVAYGNPAGTPVPVVQAPVQTYPVQGETPANPDENGR